MPESERRLAAIMFTDMVGYTTLAQSDETLALGVLDRHNQFLRPIFHRYRGREVKTMGDSFLVEFESALDATNCGIEVQRSLHDYNLSSKQEWAIRLRIGVHLGDVVHSHGDVFGDAVNIASRIQPLADPEGVCLSQQVYDQIKNKLRSPLVSLPAQQLKNVKGPTGVYRVVMPWEKEPAPKEHALETKRIAVLPFVNMSPDSNDEFFADGMTEELISTLSKIERVELISRTSVMQYKKAPKPIKEISRDLEAGTIIEGSIRKAGNRLRVAVQMIDAEKDRHLWAENYDREFQDVFAIQSDIARNVAVALQARISGGELSEVQSTESLEAYALYLKATQLYHEDTDSSLREAIALFEQAITKDPAFARAYAGLTLAWVGLAVGSYEDFTTATERAEASARTALELGPDSSEAHAAMAAVDGLLDRTDEGISEAEKALRMNPNLTEAHFFLGLNYASMGRLDEGLAVLKRAYELDPLSLYNGYWLAAVLQLKGKENEAFDLLSRLRIFNPGHPKVYHYLAEFYIQKQDYIKAQEMLDSGRRISPNDPELLGDQGVLYAFTQRAKEAGDVLQMLEKNKLEASRLIGEVFVYAALGNIDEAFRVLMRQAEIHSWPVLVTSLSVFGVLRKDPRFPEFCRKVGLPV